MTRDQIIEARQALVTQLPVTGEILRGSLLERTVRHTSGCTICAGGGGHPRTRCPAVCCRSMSSGFIRGVIVTSSYFPAQK